MTSPHSVDLAQVAKKVRKLPGGWPLASAIKELMDAATIVSDVKVAREAYVALNAMYDTFVGDAADSGQDASLIVPTALLDLAVVRYVRGAHGTGSRKSIDIRSALTPKMQSVHDEVLKTRNKYVAHSTSEKLVDVTVFSTVVWEITPNAAGMVVDSRYPEYHVRSIPLGELGDLLSEALEIVRAERKRREAIVSELFRAAPPTGLIAEALATSPFAPDSFFPNIEWADAYRTGLDGLKDDIVIQYTPREQP